MNLLLDLRVSDFLAARPTSNCRRLNRTFPLFIPETLLLGSPKTFGATITAGKTDVFVIERRRIGIIRSLLAKVRLDSTTVHCFDLLVHGPNRSSVFQPMGSKNTLAGLKSLQRICVLNNAPLKVTEIALRFCESTALKISIKCSGFEDFSTMRTLRPIWHAMCLSSLTN